MAKRLDPSDNPLAGMRERMLRDMNRPKIAANSMAEIDDALQKESETIIEEEQKLQEELIRVGLDPIPKAATPDLPKRRRRWEDFVNREVIYLEKDLSVDLRALQDMIREKKFSPFMNKILREFLNNDTNKRRLKEYKRLFPERYKELEDQYS